MTFGFLASVRNVRIRVHRTPVIALAQGIESLRDRVAGMIGEDHGGRVGSGRDVLPTMYVPVREAVTRRELPSIPIDPQLQISTGNLHYPPGAAMILYERGLRA